MARCKGCGQEIKWITMASNGIAIPVDAKPLKYIQVKEGIGDVVEVYRTHFETCPKSGSFRRK